MAAKGEAERLGHAVTGLTSYFEPLVTSVVGTSSHMINTKQQMILLDQTKTLTEGALQLLYAAKEGGGNPKVRDPACWGFGLGMMRGFSIL